MWDVDIEDANHEEFGVESANSVLERTSGLVLELDDLLHQGQQQHKGGEEQQHQQQQQNQRNRPWKCILVAHGDVLQILQTGFLKHEDAKRHRSLEHLETATIRELILPSS